MAGTSAKRGPIVGINMTPMVDIMLVLLVIMMVTATFIVAQSFNVELPKTATSDEPATSPLVVTLEKSDRILFNDAPVTELELRSRLGEAVATTKDPTLVVSADREVQHGQVMHVVDLAKVAGITKFALNVERVE